LKNRKIDVKINAFVSLWINRVQQKKARSIDKRIHDGELHWWTYQALHLVLKTIYAPKGLKTLALQNA